MSQEGTRFRSRVVPAPYGQAGPKIGTWFLLNGNAWIPWRDERASVGYPYVIAESVRDDNHGHGPYYDGGPLTVIKFGNFVPSAPLGRFTHTSQARTYPISGYGNVKLKYNGGFYPDSTMVTALNGYLTHLIDIGTTPSGLVSNTATLEGMAYNKVRPKVQKAQIGVALAEARDIPRMLQTTAKAFHQVYSILGGKMDNLKNLSAVMKPKNIGDHFLNHQFGWLPFLNDLGDLDHLIRNSVDITSRMTRENGKWMKRSATLVNDSTRILVEQGTGLKVIPNIDQTYTLLSTDPTYEVWKETYTVSKAIGRCKYYLPEFDESLAGYSSVWNRIRQAQTLSGIRVNPSNLYKATPWTWAIDWFTHFGHNIDLMQDQIDNIAFKYLYVTHHKVERYVFTQHMPFKDLGMQHLTWSRDNDIKQRREADSPFGFGLTWDGLSPNQIAILAALGVTRH